MPISSRFFLSCSGGRSSVPGGFESTSFRWEDAGRREYAARDNQPDFRPHAPAPGSRQTGDRPATVLIPAFPAVSVAPFWRLRERFLCFVRAMHRAETIVTNNKEILVFMMNSCSQAYRQRARWQFIPVSFLTATAPFSQPQKNRPRAFWTARILRARRVQPPASSWFLHNINLKAE